MKEPQLTDRAKADLKGVWSEIARRRDAATANRMSAAILEKCRSHAQFPETGQTREELAPGLRSFPVDPYVVFFRPVEDTIQVLRVLHGRRDINRIMGKKKKGKNHAE
jgi:toxin ParE1/3/4